jgi:hypothetical protein
MAEIALSYLFLDIGLNSAIILVFYVLWLSLAFLLFYTCSTVIFYFVGSED